MENHPLIIFRPCLKYGRKIILSNGAFFYPMFANRVHVFTDVRSRLEKKLTALKCLSGHVVCSFDNHAKNIRRKSENF